jgi:hypothetical protein
MLSMCNLNIHTDRYAFKAKVWSRKNHVIIRINALAKMCTVGHDAAIDV